MQDFGQRSVSWATQICLSGFRGIFAHDKNVMTCERASETHDVDYNAAEIAHHAMSEVLVFLVVQHNELRSEIRKEPPTKMSPSLGRLKPQDRR